MSGYPHGLNDDGTPPERPADAPENDQTVRAREQAGGLEHWAAVLVAHKHKSSAAGIVMLREAAKTLRCFADAPPKAPWKEVLKQDEIIEIDENGKVHLPPSDAAPQGSETKQCCEWRHADSGNRCELDAGHSGGHRFENMTPQRPDTAPPKEVMPNDTLEHTRTGVHVNGAPSEPPPSDAAPVAEDWEPTTSFTNIAAKVPDHPWEVTDDQGRDYRVDRVAPTVDGTLIIWVVPLDAHPEDAPGGPWWLHSAEGGWTLHCFEELGGFEEGVHLSEDHGFSVEVAEAILGVLNRDALDRPKGDET